MTHVMLSYQWNSQNLVKKIHDHLSKEGVPCWMDIKGGIKADFITCMSEGVEEAAVIICFCSKDYQNSRNCQTELKYAYELKIPVIPIICDTNYTVQQQKGEKMDPAKWPCKWLGAIIAGQIYIDFRKDSEENAGLVC